MKKESKNNNKNHNKVMKKELSMKYFSNISKNKRDIDEKIKEILTEEMNKECFDCGSFNPKYISLNNGIFLCNECTKIHNQFTLDISLIKNNNLFLLSNKEILYLYYGGNSRLNNFVNYEFPGLQNYQPNILYRTQAMNYYRNRLNAIVCKRKRPEKPNCIYAYKLIGENTDKYSKNRLNLDNNDNNKILIENNYNYNNGENISVMNQYNNKNEIGKNLKYIYSSLNIKNIDNARKQKINLDSIYQNNNINNTFNITFAQKMNKNIKKRKNFLNNNLIKDQHLYNSTFFEEMKNIFKDKNIKGKIRMKLNEKKNDEKIEFLKDDLLTHQASLSNTIYFPNNNIDINNNNNNQNNLENSKYLKKINLNRFTSLKNYIKTKNKNIVLNEDNNMKIYIKPRMSNNSFSKKYQIKNTTEKNDNNNCNRKQNNIINGLTKFSLKNINLKEEILTNINRKENGFKPRRHLQYSKSNTLENIFKINGEINNRKENKNKLKNRISDIRKVSNRELSFNNHNRKINLNLNDTKYKYNIKEKSTNNYNYKKKMYNKINNTYNNDNEINNNENGFNNNKIINSEYKKKINSNRIKNIINNNNNIINDNIEEKKRNFIKVIKTTIGKRNNPEFNWQKKDYFNLKNLKTNKEINPKVFNLNILNENENINNIFLCEKNAESERERILKAIKDKKEQELIEQEDFQKLLLDENSLYNKDIYIDLSPKKNNKKNIEKNEEIVNGGMNNKTDINSQKNIFYKNKDNNNDILNKKNCTDLILISKNTNNINNKNVINNKEIPNDFMIELKNIINKNKENKEIKNDINNNNNNNQITFFKNKNIRKFKSMTKNNSIKSIRNKYKEKTTIFKYENKTTINEKYKKNPLNNSFNKKSNNFINEGNIVKNKKGKIIDISEENWNINQLGQINIYEEINDIELN